MVRKEIGISAWSQQGNVYFFREDAPVKRLSSVYNLDFVGEGKDGFIQLLDLLGGSEEGQRRTVRLSPPEGAALMVRTNKPLISWNRLIVEKSGQEGICIREDAEKVFLLLGGSGAARMIEELRSAYPQEESIISGICGDRTVKLIIWC